LILYAESSAVLAWLFGEATQEQILTAFADATAVLTSRLTLVECQRAIHVAETLERISALDGNLCRQLLARAARGWSILELTGPVCQRAGQRFPVEPVRALDALHLASLLELHAVEPRLQPLSLDQRLRQNAARLGFVPVP
jgi:hypothetical protein